MSILNRDIELEKYLEAKRSYEEKRKRDPRYLKYINHKAIPYAFELGFDTLFIGSDVLEKIMKHWLQNDTEVGIDKRVAGIFFGHKRGTQIKIEDCFRFKFSAGNDIITDAGFYKTKSEFLGIYSNGKIPHETDVTMVAKLSEHLKQSVFLLKYIWSEELNNISTTIFENVVDLCKETWSLSLISVQLHHHPPHETFITSECSDCDRKDSKVFYLDKDWSPSMFRRYDPDITDYQRSKLKERVEERDHKRQSFFDFRDTLLKRAKYEKWFDVGVRYEPGDDCLKMAEKFCEKAKLELRFSFKIPLAGENEITDKSLVEIRNEIFCDALVVNFIALGLASSSIRESHCKSAWAFLIAMQARLLQLLTEESSSNAENSYEQPKESSKTVAAPTALTD